MKNQMAGDDSKIAEPDTPPGDYSDDHSDVYYVPYDHGDDDHIDPDPQASDGETSTNSSLWLPGNATDLLWETNRQRVVEVVPLLALMALLLLVSLVGNTLVCLVYRTRFRRNTTSLLVVFLAGLDLVFLSLGVAMETAVLALPFMYRSAAACKAARFVETSGVCVTLLALAGVAADRYCKLCRPVDCLPLRRARWYCGLAMVLALGLAVPACFVFGLRSVSVAVPHGLHQSGTVRGTSCGTDDTALDSPMRVVYVALLLTTFTCATLTMSVLYALILVRICRRKASASRGERVSPGRKDYPRKHRFVTEDSTSSCGGGPEEGRRLPSASCSSAGSSTAGPACTTPKQGRTSPAAMTDPARVPLKGSGVKESARIGRGGSTTVDVQSTRMTTIFFVVSATCCVCLLPHLLIRTLRATTHLLDGLQAPAAVVLYEMGVRSYLLHAPLKPLIYLAFNHSFRRECRHLLVKLWASSSCAGDPAASAAPRD